MSGESSVLLTAPLSVLPHAKSGKLRAIAISNAKRSSAFPELPTVAAGGGASGYEYTSWYGLLAPGGTPGPIIKRLAQTVARALRTKEFRSCLVNEGFERDGTGAGKLRKVPGPKYIELVPTIDGLRAD